MARGRACLGEADGHADVAPRGAAGRPLFHQLSHMCGVLHVPAPTMLGAVSALMRQGYRVSRSHTDPNMIKTDAPNRALWDMLRCHAATQPKRTRASLRLRQHMLSCDPPLVEADFGPTERRSYSRKRTATATS